MLTHCVEWSQFALQHSNIKEPFEITAYRLWNRYTAM